MVPYYSMKIFHKFCWSRAIGPNHPGVSLRAKLMRRKIQYAVLPERYFGRIAYACNSMVNKYTCYYLSYAHAGFLILKIHY
jgi:hypothetical protein